MPILDLKQKKTRLLVIATVIAVVVVGICVKLFFFSAPPISRMTAVVTPGNIEESVLASGTLKPVKLVAVGAQVSGRVIAVNVVRGQKVKKGDLVAQIDSVTQQNNLQTAKAALANMRAQRVEKQATLTNERRILARRKQLSELKAVSQTDLESADTDVRTTLAQIAALDAQIDEAKVAVGTAEANLGYTRITAPIDGTVLAIVSQEGQTVNAAQSAPTIVILGQLDIMTVRAEISEADVVKVKPGLPVYFTILGAPDLRYETKLASIDPAPESITSDSSFSSSTTSSTTTSSSSSAIYYIGIFNMPNPNGRLRTYMTAEVHIILGQAKNVLTVPSAALARAPGGRYTVQVVGADGKISPRAVEVGLNNKISAEIRSGLKAGERVVTGETSATTKTTNAGGGGPPPMF
jgi:membrane fusion protein, macrolide-specific efflux system